MTRRPISQGATDKERGSATIWTVALLGLLAAFTAAVVLMITAIGTRHQAERVADTAALAAARAALTGLQYEGDPQSGEPCAAAARSAAAGHLTLRDCDCDALDCAVTVEGSFLDRMGWLTWALCSATGFQFGLPHRPGRSVRAVKVRVSASRSIIDPGRSTVDPGGAAELRRRRAAASCAPRSRDRRIPIMSSQYATSRAQVQMAPIRKIWALVVRMDAPKKVSESGVAAEVTTPTANNSTAAMTPSATAITAARFPWLSVAFPDDFYGDD